MERSVYVNEAWVPESEAAISVFDRGLLFGDAVYEIVAVLGGKLVEFQGHIARLERSLRELAIPSPVSDDALLALHREAVSRNQLVEGLIYLQISRGTTDRDFVFGPNMRPNLTLFTQRKDVLANPKAKTGLKVKTSPEGRWRRRDIKTVQLLFSSLEKTRAAREGFDDVILLEDGFVTEASSANIHIVSRDGTLITPPLSSALLPGITRASVLSLAREAGLAVREAPISVQDLHGAQEVFLTSATSFVMPIVAIDGRAVGAGQPGPLGCRLREIYSAASSANAI